jgi:7-cyano-7-deazaguanine synthase
MVTNGKKNAQPAAVLFSAGLDSAVMLAQAAAGGPAYPIYVRAGLAWEAEESAAASRLLASPPFAGSVEPVVTLTVDMRDVYPPHHWAVKGEAPGFDTPDEDVYIDGRNIVLLAKASVHAARARLPRMLLGPLSGNPFPDATPEFFDAMARALSLGLDSPIRIETPLVTMNKAEVITLGAALGVPLELTLSCMQPRDGLHCGRCSKCRERRDGFLDAGIADPTRYRERPLR